MIALLSPSKSMNMDIPSIHNTTHPDFLKKSEQLVEQLRTFSTDQLADFMDISTKLAQLNEERFKQWNTPFTPNNAKPALLAFTGDVYDGLDASTLTEADCHFAQDHLRILSGLYGIIRPLDLIQPYRLEMGRALQTAQADNLYSFWETPILEHLSTLSQEPIINLASQEYFKAVPRKQISNTIISPVFKDEKNGSFKIISFYAKKARGLMARYLIQNRLTTPNQLLQFDLGGYHYNATLSQPNEPVFTRAESDS
ncbi:MAG: peroxide stress protein YaaA [Kiritimatiellaceae bacterium]|nr:MAG: peroxide stress protein YaaA [Kiritimatiellaceae bacterium]|tara:strand:- start:131 stop:895 length:765 start_codon:yes stop_codon:yes gene_type:complete